MCHPSLRQDTCLFVHCGIDPARTRASPGVCGAFFFCHNCDKNRHRHLVPVLGTGWRRSIGCLTPSTQSNLFPKLICFFYLETHKVSTSIRGGFHILLHKTFLEHVHSARLTCTADTRPLNEFEKVRIWPEIE